MNRLTVAPLFRLAGAGQFEFVFDVVVVRIRLGELLEERDRFFVFLFLEISVGQAGGAGMRAGDFVDHCLPELDGLLGLALSGVDAGQAVQRAAGQRLDGECF